MILGHLRGAEAPLFHGCACVREFFRSLLGYAHRFTRRHIRQGNLDAAPCATENHLVKVATFNINNINKRLDNLLAWLEKAEPDVVSLQELKAEQEALRGHPKPANEGHLKTGQRE